MSNKFMVTFERWSHDDAEVGETDDKGFVMESATLREAMRNGLEFIHPKWAGPCEPSDSRLANVRWLSFYRWNDGTRDYYESGIEETRSLHIPEHVTPASRQRIARLFGCVGI